jgi:hypothetical protein
MGHVGGGPEEALCCANTLERTRVHLVQTVY